MRTQRETNDVNVGGSVLPESLDELGQALAHVGHVVNRDGVAGPSGVSVPVNGDQVVFSFLKVLLADVDQRVQLHVRVVPVDDDLGGVSGLEVRESQIRAGFVEEYFLRLIRVVLGVQVVRDLGVGAGVIGVDEARPDEEVPGGDDELVVLDATVRDEVLGEDLMQQCRGDEEQSQDQGCKLAGAGPEVPGHVDGSLGHDSACDRK